VATCRRLHMSWSRRCSPRTTSCSNSFCAKAAGCHRQVQSSSSGTAETSGSTIRKDGKIHMPAVGALQARESTPFTHPRTGLEGTPRAPPTHTHHRTSSSSRRSLNCSALIHPSARYPAAERHTSSTPCSTASEGSDNAATRTTSRRVLQSGRGPTLSGTYAGCAQWTSTGNPRHPRTPPPCTSPRAGGDLVVACGRTRCLRQAEALAGSELSSAGECTAVDESSSGVCT
jgi:hypothetical protein